MSPNFLSGDYVITSVWPFSRYRPGDVVVVGHPVYDTIIKRVVEINAVGELLLQGDSVNSTSTEALGWRARDEVLGKVVWHIQAKKSKHSFRPNTEQ